MRSDPGYALLNWVSAQLGWGIYGVNLISGGLFCLGLTAFCRRQPYPWLALAVAIPYLVVVVAMGYTRQAVAIGLAMLALVALADRRRLVFVLWLGLAATFHKSAVILLPLAARPDNRYWPWTAAWVCATGLLFYYLLVSEQIDALYRNYVEAEYASQGAQIRVFMNALPAVLFLAMRSRFPLMGDERSLWSWVSLLALGFVLAYALSPSSTAVDRLALYLIPLQLFVFARLPAVLRQPFGYGAVVWAVVGYYAAVLFVWLNFADNAPSWLPYRFYLLPGL